MTGKLNMDNVQKLLQISAKLYNDLTKMPSPEERDEFIKMIDESIEERGKLVEALKIEKFQFDASIKNHQMLKELDQGIIERLNKVKLSIQDDLKILQNTKKNEAKYLNPYSNVQVMDGRYYDRKK